MVTHPSININTDLNFTDLLRLVETMPLEREARRRQLLGSLRRIADVLGPKVAQSRLDAALAETLRKVKHQTFGISASRWRNILCDFRFCCRAAGIGVGRSYAPMTAAWQDLYDRVTPEARRRLVRFARYCSEAGIEPDAVDDQVATDYLDWLRAGEFSKNPYNGYRLLARLWNAQGERNLQWPAYRFSVPDRRHRENLGWDDFPESLRTDLASWEKQVSSSFDFDLDAAVLCKPLAPRTIQTRKHQLLTLASAAVRAGHPIETLTSLAVLCDKTVYVAALRRLRVEQGKERSSWLANIAGAILPIARHHVRVGEDAYTKLSAAHKQVTPDGRGLNQKNKQRLDQFNDDQCVDDLQALPSSVVRRLRSSPPDRRRALIAQAALAIQILLDAPIRLANLTGLNLERHLVWRGIGRHRSLSIMIEAAEVKNKVALDFPVPAPTARMITEYLEVYHPLLARDGSPWLFPGHKTGQPKAASGVGTQIKRFVLEHLGVEMHPHLFRHLAAKVYLAENPGAYGTVADVLGHKSVETTRKAYAGFDKAGSVRHYQRYVDPTRRKGSK